MKYLIKDFVLHCQSILAARMAGASILLGLAVLLLLPAISATALAQGLPIKNCVVNGSSVQAYLCLDDIIVVDGSGNPNQSGGLYLVDPVTGNQTPISSAVNAQTTIGGQLVNLLTQAASVTIEPGTGKLLASTRTYGVIRVDPKDGSQEVLLKGGLGWGSGFPTFFDSTNSANESFIYPGGITIDPVDSSILVTDTGIRLNACANPNDVTTCASDPGKIIRIKKGQGAGVYTGTAVVAKGGLLSSPFDIAVGGASTGGSSLYVTDMKAKLGAPVNNVADPGNGGIIFLDASNNYNQRTFFASWPHTAFQIGELGTILSGSGYTDGTYNVVPLIGGTGAGATAKIIVTAGSVASVQLLAPGSGYTAGDSLTAAANSIGGGAGFSVKVAGLSSPQGCPMGITVNGMGTVFATVFTYKGFGCAPQAVFSLQPDSLGINPPTLNTVINGYPLQFPFGMDTDKSGRILIADEGSGYGCKGTIFRLDLSKPIVTTFDGNLSDFNPFALSPIVGSPFGCTPPNQTNLVTPSDVAVVKVFVSLNISTQTPTITWGTPAPITYGAVLSSAQLNATATVGGTTVAGTFVYTPPAGALLPAGSQTLSVTFTPTDTTSYNTPPPMTVTLTVNQATPIITWPNPAAITYGTALSNAQLNATASVNGTFIYTPGAGTILPAGSQTLSATFTPADAANYTTATATMKLTVTQAPLTVTADNKTKMYGASLPPLSVTYSGFQNGETSGHSQR